MFCAKKKIISYTFGKQTPHIMLLSLSVSACDIFYNYNINHWKLFNRVKGKVVTKKKKKKHLKVSYRLSEVTEMNTYQKIIHFSSFGKQDTRRALLPNYDLKTLLLKRKFTKSLINWNWNLTKTKSFKQFTNIFIMRFSYYTFLKRTTRHKIFYQHFPKVLWCYGTVRLRLSNIRRTTGMFEKSNSSECACARLSLTAVFIF